ncbi:Pyridine nucleotide-disulfide oxidoreductase [Musa troglodytarum]|uniref:NADH:ubiquinone reductase (non-electrogenic) n=1 Tax=Musa troglodytarum TaxID=320322 RepID=A0A9E7F8I9_9LILI|nr:Pyridine nucleotide-disulfide oxidoreductase [Musa troglodytarum]
MSSTLLAAPTGARSMMEEMLIAIRLRDEKPKDALPALPVRPTLRRRPPSSRNSLPMAFKGGSTAECSSSGPDLAKDKSRPEPREFSNGSSVKDRSEKSSMAGPVDEKFGYDGCNGFVEEEASKEDGQKVHPSRLDDLENLVLKTKAELQQKEKENVALLQQVQQCEKKWSLFELKLKSIEEMYQTQIDTLKVNLATAQKSISASDTVKQPLKFEGAMSAEAQTPEETPIKHHVTESTVADDRNNVVHHLTKEFEQQKQVFEDDARVLSEVNSGQSGSVAKSIEELRNLTIRYEAWRKEYKVRLCDAKASLLKLGKSEVHKSIRWRMRSATFFLDGAFRRGSAFSKLVLIFAASGGALVAYADARTDPATEPSQAAPKKKVVVLGTGWAGTTFVRNVDSSLYDVQVISPRNYFAFTPLLPSVTCGTVEPRSIVEPIRKIIRKKGGEIKFWEAECFNIDPDNKKVHCRTNTGTNLERNGEFLVDYDYLVIAVGARVNTFNTPGVVQHCHFLKEVEDAQKIRKSVIDSFERAILPDLDEEERKRTLHFVIVGGGPTGVEFAAELHDFISEDLAKLYPTVCNLVKISVIEHGGHILTMFDKRISKFAEEKFRRDGIELRTGYRVVKVSDNTITMEDKLHVESSVSYGMAVWSAGVGARPIILDFMKQIAQGNRRALATDEWLRVRECDGVYAIGDCATMSQRKVMEDILEIFKFADKDNSGTLTVKEINDALEDICIRYPQVELYLKSNQMSNIVDLIKASKGDVRKESVELDIEEFKNALADVDSEVKNLPATAQVAAQQGNYLASCFNRMKHCDKKPEGPLRIRELGRHRFRPFRYKHLGQFAPLGGEQTAAQLPGDWISIGHSSQWLWYSVYASKQVSWRTRALVISDWTRRFIHGRDSSCI